MRYYGTIIRWNESRQFGAIREESTENEIFAPFSAFHCQQETPTEGQRVSFNLIKGRKGRDEAEDIRFADEFDEFEGLSLEDAPPRSAATPHSRSGGIIFAFVLFGTLLAASSWYGWQAWQKHKAEAAAAAAIPPKSMVDEVAAKIKEERKAWKDAAQSHQRKSGGNKQ